MKAESLITKVYTDAEKAGEDPSAVLLSMPSAYEYEDGDGNITKMSSAEYENYVHDVGLLSYQVLVELASNSRRSAWNSLTLDQQIYTIKQVYKYAKAKNKKDFDSAYNIRGQGVWMEDLYNRKAGQSEIASAIISRAKEQ